MVELEEMVKIMTMTVMMMKMMIVLVVAMVMAMMFRLRERVVELEEELIGTQRSAGLPVRLTSSSSMSS